MARAITTALLTHSFRRKMVVARYCLKSENALTFAKFGVHYNRFTGIGLIGNITSRNFFIKNSRSLVTINLGETFRVRGEHLQYLGRKKDFSLGLSTQFDRFDITTYDQFRQDGVYNQNYFMFDTKLQYSSSRNFSMGAGSKYEWVYYSPSITTELSFRGNNDFVTHYAFLSHNTLNKNVYPKRGLKLDAVAGAGWPPASQHRIFPGWQAGARSRHYRHYHHTI